MHRQNIHATAETAPGQEATVIGRSHQGTAVDRRPVQRSEGQEQPREQDRRPVPPALISKGLVSSVRAMR